MNYAGNLKDLEIVIVTLIFSDVVPQLKIYAFHTFLYENLSVALLHFAFYIVQFSRCSFPALLKPDLKVQSLRL